MKILKMGGSFLTHKTGYRDPDGKAIYDTAKLIASLWQSGVRDLVFVHGAGSFGHSLVIKYGIGDGIGSEAQKLGYADTHASCIDLSLLIVNGLIRSGVPAISLPPAALIRQTGKRISHFDIGLVKRYLAAGFLPVLHGDMVPDETLGGSVCSGDQIVAYLGKEADMMILATDVDGVLDDNGRVVPSIDSTDFAEISKHLKDVEEGGKDVTGAMRGKIEELLAIDTPSYIVNAANPERIIDLVHGKKTICTMVKK